MTATTHLIFGPPGTGKTTTLKRWVERAADLFGPRKVLVASFTRAAAAEIASRIDLPRENVGTLHALCFRALGRPELTEGHEHEFNRRHAAFELPCRGGRAAPSVEEETPTSTDRVDEPFDQPEETRGQQHRAAVDLLRNRRVPESRWPSHLLPFHRAWTKWKQDAGLLDFTDLLEQSLAVLQSAPGGPGAIFFDEGQDASRLQMDVLTHWGQSAQRLVLAGDDDQSIFNFAGADADNLLRFPGNAERHYLRQSHRLPRVVHRLADQWIHQLFRREEKQFAPRDEEGFLSHCAATWKRPERVVDLVEQYMGEGKSVMLMAACSYLLEPLKRVLRDRGIPFANPWRRHRGDWNPLASGGASRQMPVDRIAAFLRPDRDTWGDEAGLWRRADLASWAGALAAKESLIRGAKKALVAMKKDHDPASYDDLTALFQPERLAELDGLPFATHADCVRALRWWAPLLHAADRGKYEYPLRVQEVYGGKALRDPPLVTIGTGHSLKGAEADVAIVFPDLSAAGWEAWSSSRQGREGIIRLFYVMLTRARQGVVLCAGASPRSLRLQSA